jgi:hypothetical protein
MKVKTADLRRAADVLWDHLEDTGHSEIEIDVDYYWDVPEGQRYDPYTEPVRLDLGQLSDDWKELTNVLERSSEPVNYALVWLAAILRRIGESSPG